MKYIKILLLILLLLPLFIVQAQYKALPMKQDFNAYKAEERPWIWWFWLGNIVSEKLIDQHLEAYARSGYGGATIISTYGVKGYEDRQIEYRSPRWYQILDYTIQRAKALNMRVDLALTSAWPFGGAQVSKENGARRLARHESYLSAGIVNITVCNENEFPVSVVAFGQDGNYIDLTSSVKNGVLKYTLPAGNWTIESVVGNFTGQQVKRSSLGGEGLVIDHFSDRAIKEYLADFDKDVSKMKGIRSTFNDSYEVYGADFTLSLIAEFEKRRGYSPKAYMHLLFDKQSGEIQQRFLCDYRTTMAELILENFADTWTQWSNKNGFKTTEQAHGAPANTLDLFGAADIPQCESFGPSCFNIPNVRIDSDTKRDKYKWPDKLFMKFASSAAHVNGRKLVSSETGTWLTNHFRMALSQIKPQIDELFVSGINHIHLISSTNTPLDSPYPGWVFYPASDFGPRVSYFDYLPDMSRFVARSQHLLQNSTPDNDILLYYPIADYFSEVKPDLGVLSMMDHIPTKWGSDFPFVHTAKKLWENGYSFDYISDKQITELRIENNTLITSGGGQYKTLIIPVCKRMPTETMDKILELADKGISVIFDTRMPVDVPGLNKLSERLSRLNVQCRLLSKILSVAVAANLDSTLVAMKMSKEYFYTNHLEYIRRNMGKGKMYYVANQDSIFKSSFIKLGTAFGNIEIFDPLTGKTGIPFVENRNDGQYVFLELLPGQSLVLKTNVADPAKNAWAYFNQKTGVILKTNWNISFDKSVPYTPLAVKTDRLISWTALGDSTYMYYTGTALYSAVFDCPSIIAGSKSVRLLFTDLRDMAEIFINGKSVGRTWSVPYLIDFDAKLLKPKGNKLEIKVSNIATNRVIWMDRNKIKWQECYIADPKKREFNTADWDIEPAGIIGDIKLIGSND